MILTRDRRPSTAARPACWAMGTRNWISVQQRDQREVAPADCCNWGEWRLKEYTWKGSLLGWFNGLHAGTKDFCSALAALVGPVQNTFFPLRTPETYIQRHAACTTACPDGWAMYWADHSNQGRIKVSYTGRAVLMNQCGRTPFICTRRVPIHLCCNSVQGPPLSGLSDVHSISIPLSPSLSKLAGQPCWVACLLVCVCGENHPNLIHTAVYIQSNDSPQTTHNISLSLIYRRIGELLVSQSYRQVVNNNIAIRRVKPISRRC